MSSLSTDHKGNRRLLFAAKDGTRKTVRLGKIPAHDARCIKTRVDYLILAQDTGCLPPPEVTQWAENLDGAIARRLARVGLIRRRQDTPVPRTLAAFLNGYIAGRTDVRPATRENLALAKRHLIEFFGPDRPLSSIALGDADDFRRGLFQKLADNSVRRLCGRAKQFFRAAHRKRLIHEDPFADMKGCGVKANQSRLRFVSRTEAEKVMNACPNVQWRLLVALARWGGLRVPSEPLVLTWVDIDWESDRFTVNSPKTGPRIVPMFPELKPHLEAAFDEAEPGTIYVITKYRGAKVNLRTQLNRIIRRAGLEPWAKPWQNLRSTRETELVEAFPLHVACAWIGNSAAVATKHYLQVTAEHFQKATAGSIVHEYDHAAEEASR